MYERMEDDMDDNCGLILDGSMGVQEAGRKIFELDPPPDAGDVVMFLYINFHIQQRDIQGYIALLMDMPSLTNLKDLLGLFIERTAGGGMSTSDARA